jgi:hypothetical protein
LYTFKNNLFDSNYLYKKKYEVIEKSLKELEHSQATKALAEAISAGKLSLWSHIEGSPWDLLRIEGANWNTEIDLNYIKIYFSEKVENVINQQ